MGSNWPKIIELHAAAIAAWRSHHDPDFDAVMHLVREGAGAVTGAPTDLPETLQANGSWRAIAIAAWDAPSWREAAADYHKIIRANRPTMETTPPERLAQLRRLMADNVSLDRASHELNDSSKRPTPQATVEAIMFAVRARGVAALKEPATKERLSRCDAAALTQIDQRLTKLREAQCRNTRSPAATLATSEIPN